MSNGTWAALAAVGALAAAGAVRRRGSGQAPPSGGAPYVLVTHKRGPGLEVQGFMDQQSAASRAAQRWDAQRLEALGVFSTRGKAAKVLDQDQLVQDWWAGQEARRYAGAANKVPRRKSELIGAILTCAGIPRREHAALRRKLTRLKVPELREVFREVRGMVTA